MAAILDRIKNLGFWGHAPPPHKYFENLDAKSCNMRVFWSENVFPKKTVLRVFFFPSNMKIMKFDMIANKIATKEHRTMISQFSPSMINKTYNPRF
jgi:hypothetical protein